MALGGLEGLMKLGGLEGVGVGSTRGAGGWRTTLRFCCSYFCSAAIIFGFFACSANCSAVPSYTHVVSEMACDVDNEVKYTVNINKAYHSTI
jgi:hypothetical protein